jgi:hypothetical protein
MQMFIDVWSCCESFSRAIFVDFIAHGTKEPIPIGVGMKFIGIHRKRSTRMRVVHPKVCMFA